LANFRIAKRKCGIDPLFERVRQWDHMRKDINGSKRKQKRRFEKQNSSGECLRRVINRIGV
jgi:hypothetical protein